MGRVLRRPFDPNVVRPRSHNRLVLVLAQLAASVCAHRRHTDCGYDHGLAAPATGITDAMGMLCPTLEGRPCDNSIGGEQYASPGDELDGAKYAIGAEERRRRN
jgi:hypothetical protein